MTDSLIDPVVNYLYDVLEFACIGVNNSKVEVKNAFLERHKNYKLG